MSKYCVLVSSCDAYADCWLPFFSLLERYWPTPRPPVYLNTETQSFVFPGLDVRCPRVSRNSRKSLTWSERLLRCLETIPYEVILYVQEDYFLKAQVDVTMMKSLVDLMLDDSVSHISLVADGRPGQRSRYPCLSHIARSAEYRISAQAGLWRLAALRSYLRSHETIWEFEWYGTRRARRRKDTFFFVNEEYTEITGRELVFPYDGTGVEQGLWRRSVVEDLFARHGIAVDYSGRGFLEENGGYVRRRPTRAVRAVRRLRSLI